MEASRLGDKAVTTFALLYSVVQAREISHFSLHLGYCTMKKLVHTALERTLQFRPQVHLLREACTQVAIESHRIINIIAKTSL